MNHFSGSYLASDVQFLLKPIQINSTPIAEKERLIQTGKKHYSEMISQESLPSAAYLDLFQQIFQQNKVRFATDLLILAKKIHLAKKNKITLVSLVRAGTPIGVLLHRILQQYFHRQSHHYSISIIRDRGIDINALQTILMQQNSAESITFIDGWTGKGVITQELKQSIAQFNQHVESQICADLYVLNDIAGVAAVTASFSDYLIPCSLLNATISGLISRSILNQASLNKNDFHGCIYYADFLAADLSQWFITETMATVAQIFKNSSAIVLPKLIAKNTQQKTAISFMNHLKKTYHIQHNDLIKPGIGEATRVLLRRVPGFLLLKNKHAPETQHLIVLANEKNIPILENSTMPYQAVSIIAKHTL